MPVLNKIDMKNADVDSSCDQLKKLFDFEPTEVMKVSAKTGVGVQELLGEIIERIPPPTATDSGQFKAVVFDQWYEKFKGIVLLVRVLNGKIEVGNQILFSTNPEKIHTVKELNILHPHQVALAEKPATLYSGQVGVLVANIHDYADMAIGDNIVLNDGAGLELIKGEKESKTKSLKSHPMVYASIYPCEKSNYSDLLKSVQKLLLNDCSVHMTRESHAALGNGFK